MAAAFAGDAVVNLRPNFRFSLYFSLIFRNFELETGSNPTASSATQSGLPELGWKTLADIWRADPPRPVVANTPRLEPLGRSRVKSGDRREKWNAFRNVTFIPNSGG